jgi:MOSC domain-containing protein
VHVSRIGLTPVKGTRHADRPWVDLVDGGPVGDRVFCLVDSSRLRVVRTVEHPTLMSARATWHAGVLSVALPEAAAEGVPRPGRDVRKVDYWGRTVALEVLDGPWAAILSEHLGLDVELARAPQPGDVVYGGSVSLVTTSSLHRLREELGTDVDDTQFRATFTVSSDGEPAAVEDSWIGRRLRIGNAEVEVRSGLPRCAVVDLDPDTGRRRAPVLRTLAGYRRAGGEILFGVDAAVTRPGRVEVGDVVERS